MFDRIAGLIAQGVPPMPQRAAEGGTVHRRVQGKWARLPDSQNIEDRRGEPEPYGPSNVWPWLDPTPAPGGRLPTALGINDVPVPRSQGGLVDMAGGHYAIGGAASMPRPMREMSMNPPGLHLIHSATPGRTDRIRMKAKPGSFVLPADVVSGVGQGNTTAGAKIFGEMIAAGPYGAKMKHMGRGALPKMPAMKPPGMQMPKAPAMHFPGLKAPPHAAAAPAPVAGLGSMASPGMSSTGRSLKQERFLHAQRADGGITPEQQPDDELTPIVVAGGEAIIDPEVIAAYGNGDIEEGKKIWHNAVVHLRKQINARNAKLPAPIA